MSTTTIDKSLDTIIGVFVHMNQHYNGFPFAEYAF